MYTVLTKSTHKNMLVITKCERKDGGRRERERKQERGRATAKETYAPVLRKGVVRKRERGWVGWEKRQKEEKMGRTSKP